MESRVGYEVPRYIYLLTAVISLVFIVILAGIALMPSFFWDQVVWPYFWGPVVADGMGHPVEGIKEGYNIFNTLIYGILLSLMLYWVYALLRKLKIEADWKFMLALSPFVALGGSMRALEDAQLFETPTSYFFIAPQIYMVIAFFVVASLFFMWLLTKRLPIHTFAGDPGLIPLVLIIMVMSVLALLFNGILTTTSFHPFWIPLMALVAFVASRLSIFRDEGGVSGYLSVIASTGTFLFLMSGAYILKWLQHPWILGTETYPIEVVIIPAIAIGATLLFLMIFWGLSRSPKLKTLSMYLLPASILVLAGHMLDSAATCRGLSAFGYTEKHVLSRTVIDIAGTPLSMFLLKGAVVGMIIFLIEVSVKKEMKDKTLLGLLYLAVFVLGFAPGLRDLLRIAMGV